MEQRGHGGGEVQGGPYRSISRHPLYQEINQSLVATIDVHEGDAIVDLGCGDGAISQILVERYVDRVRIWAVDPDEEMLCDARSLVGAHVGTTVATAETFGQLFPPGSCDVVILANALQLVTDRTALYASLRRVLAPGGVFAFNSTFYLSDELRKSTSHAMKLGFEVRSLARRRGLAVPPLNDMGPAAHFAKMLPPVGELVDELRSASFEVTRAEERTWMLDTDFLSSYMSAPYEAATVLPGYDMSVLASLLEEATDKVTAKSPDQVPRPWLTVVARRSEVDHLAAEP